MKNIRYFIEAVFINVLTFLFGMMPAHMASAFGGWLGRTIGPRLAATRKARRNLEYALPGRSEQQYDEIITDMWDNLGRIFAEYPHLKTLGSKYVELVGIEHIRKATAEKKPIIFMGAHLGNWETTSVGPIVQAGISMDISYRAPNNPWADRLLHRMRSLDGRIKAHSKSRAGGRGVLESIKSGKNLGILIDQKYNEGIEASFFGHKAMTNPFFVQIAQKYNAVLIPTRCERMDGVKMRITLYDPIPHEGRSIEDVIADAHAILERWIIERPGQWLWLHRRWKDQKNDPQAL